jgi:hypothetical protein
MTMPASQLRDIRFPLITALVDSTELIPPPDPPLRSRRCPEGAVEDPIVMRLEEEHPHLVTKALRPVSGAVSQLTTIAAKEEDAEERVPRGPDAQDAEVMGRAEVEQPLGESQG